MIEAKADLFEFYGQPNMVICFTCSPSINKRGELIMARGTAAQAKHFFARKYLRFPLTCGVTISQSPHDSVFLLYPSVYAVKTKPCWDRPATLALVMAAAQRIRTWAASRQSTRFIIPRLGCGHGGLEWRDLRAQFRAILPNNVTVVCRNPPAMIRYDEEGNLMPERPRR